MEGREGGRGKRGGRKEGKDLRGKEGEECRWERERRKRKEEKRREEGKKGEEGREENGESKYRIDLSLERTNLLKHPRETKGNRESVNWVEGAVRDPISTSEVSRGFPRALK